MPVTYTFASASAPIPLSQLDSNFATPITLGNTAIQLGNTVTTLNNMTFANATVSSGNVTATTVTATTVTSPAATALTIQSAGTTAMTIDTSQNVGIGTSSPSSYAKLASVGTSGTPQGFVGTSANGWYFNTFDSGVGYLTYSASNVIAAGFGAASNIPLFFMTNNTERMRIDSSGNVGIGKTPVGAMLDVNGAVKAGNGTAAATSYSFQGSSAIGMFTPDAGFSVAFSTGSTERMRIDSSGNVLVTSPAGLGYGTGSGGTVTQATSKSTTVTLNKPTGQITMNNAALASSAVVFFTFTNSLIGATDNLILTLTGGVTGVQNYQFWATAMASGSCTIAVKNISGGSLSEAVVFNFAIIKGATS